MSYDLKEVASHFQLDGKVKVYALGEGFINDTFIIKTEGDVLPTIFYEKSNFLTHSGDDGEYSESLQPHQSKGGKSRRRPHALMAMTIIRANDGKLYHLDEEDEYWAVSLFIDDTIA